MSSGPPQPSDPTRCSACRGTGKVISGRGAEPHEVTCPWCGGTGRFDRERDAQASAPERP